MITLCSSTFCISLVRTIFLLSTFCLIFNLFCVKFEAWASRSVYKFLFYIGTPLSFPLVDRLVGSYCPKIRVLLILHELSVSLSYLIYTCFCMSRVSIEHCLQLGHHFISLYLPLDMNSFIFLKYPPTLKQLHKINTNIHASDSFVHVVFLLLLYS